MVDFLLSALQHTAGAVFVLLLAFYFLGDPPKIDES